MRLTKRYTAVMPMVDYERLQSEARANWLSVSAFLRKLFNDYEREQADKKAKTEKAAKRAAKKAEKE